MVLNMRLTLDALHVLDTIDRRGSFAAAAEELHRVPSAITYTVQKLEEDLGARLFDRSKHRAVLTEAGRELLREGRHMLRAANALESRVTRVATGWEAELRIAYDDILVLDPILNVVSRFYREQACGTRIRLQAEVLGGCWDALVSDRADFVIGAPGDGPPGGGYSTRPLGHVDFVFAVAPRHPLAAVPDPLSGDDILQHRSISVADTSRNLPARTSGILSGQDVLTVPTLQAKLQAQLMGLGVGYLPRRLAQSHLETGRLVVKQTQEGKSRALLYLAWRTANKGKALAWLRQQVESDPGFRDAAGLSA